MPDLLALEWDHDQVAGVAAQVDGGRATVRKFFTLPRKFSGGDVPPNDWLRGELNRLEVAVPAETLVSIPRDDAFLRRLELPEAPPEELPGMVRFQVGAKSSVAIDEQSLDFLPLRRHGDIPGCDVLAATAPLTLLETIRVQVVAAGSTLRFAGLSPALCAEWIARAESQLTGGREGISLLVSRHGTRLEISAFRAGLLLFSHAARLVGDEGGEHQSIVPEVSRALVALRSAMADAKFDRAWMLVPAADQQVLGPAIERRLGCECQPLGFATATELQLPATLPDEPLQSQFAGPLALLLTRVSPRVPQIDFLDPRKTVVKPDNRGKQLKWAGVGAGALAASLLVGQTWRLWSLDSEIESLRLRDSQLAAEIKKSSPTDEAVVLVQKWQGDGIDWLRTLADLSGRMPATDRLYLESLQLVHTNNQLPKIVAHGYAREQKDVRELSSGLHTSDRYRVMPYQAARSNADTYYPWKIDGQEILLAAPSKETKTATGAKSPSRKGIPNTGILPESDSAQANPAQSSTAQSSAAGDEQPTGSRTSGTTRVNRPELQPMTKTSLQPSTGRENSAEALRTESAPASTSGADAIVQPAVEQQEPSATSQPAAEGDPTPAAARQVSPRSAQE